MRDYAVTVAFGVSEFLLEAVGFVSLEVDNTSFRSIILDQGSDFLFYFRYSKALGSQLFDKFRVLVLRN